VLDYMDRNHESVASRARVLNPIQWSLPARASFSRESNNQVAFRAKPGRGSMFSLDAAKFDS
jgi:hypothetical protein